MSQSRKLFFLFVVLGIVWGSAFVGIEIIVHILPPWFSAAARLGVASLGLFLMVYLQKGTVAIPRNVCWKIWGVGLLSVGIPFSFLFWSEQKVTGGLGGVLNGTVPIWTSLFLLFANRRKKRFGLNFQILGGVVLGFIGIWVIFYPKLALPSAHDEVLGGLGLLAMAISYAIANVLNQKILTETKGLDMETAIFHQHFVSFLYLTVLSLSLETWPSIDQVLVPNVWMTLIYLGIFPSAFAYLIYFRLLKTIGSVKTAAVTYLIPVVALGLDFLVQGHRPEPSSLAGVALILIALGFIRSSKPA